MSTPQISPPTQSPDSYAKSLIATPPSQDPTPVLNTIAHLHLQPHPEGGFYVETDRDSLLISNPFTSTSPSSSTSPSTADSKSTRNASTSIFYLLAPSSPVGHFHRNKARTVHTLHRGRGRYVVLHPSSALSGSAGGRSGAGVVKVEEFTVGHDLAAGERLQWIVEGGRWKSTYLLPDLSSEGAGSSEEGLLISETVVPGFDFEDHDFLTPEGLKGMTGEKETDLESLEWLVRKSEG